MSTPPLCSTLKLLHGWSSNLGCVQTDKITLWHFSLSLPWNSALTSFTDLLWNTSLFLYGLFSFFSLTDFCWQGQGQVARKCSRPFQMIQPPNVTKAWRRGERREDRERGKFAWSTGMGHTVLWHAVGGTSSQLIFSINGKILVMEPVTHTFSLSVTHTIYKGIHTHMPIKGILYILFTHRHTHMYMLTHQHTGRYTHIGHTGTCARTHAHTHTVVNREINVV